MKEIIVDDMKLAYKEQGEGEVILLLHGYPQNHHAWDNQFYELAKNYRVIALDWFGWGESEYNLQKDFSYHSEVERLEKVIKTLGLENFNLFAHDYGAFLALGYAEKNPENLKRLAILNSRSHKTFNSLWFTNFSLMEKVANIPYLSKIYQYLPLKTVHDSVLKSEGLKETNIYTTKFSDKNYRAWIEKFFNNYSTKLIPGLEENLKNITCPVSIIWGVNDAYIPLSTAEELLKLLRDSSLTKLNGNHFIMEDCPDQVLQALKTLLTREKSLKDNLEDKKDKVDLSTTKSLRINHVINISFIAVPLIATLFLMRSSSKKD